MYEVVFIALDMRYYPMPLAEDTKPRPERCSHIRHAKAIECANYRTEQHQRYGKSLCINRLNPFPMTDYYLPSKHGRN